MTSLNIRRMLKWLYCSNGKAMTKRLLAICFFMLVSPINGIAESLIPVKAKTPQDFVQAVCHHIQSVAQTKSVPPAFLARLLWKESRFDPNAISPKGAQGIAQFMPATAQERGLKNPFEPNSAIIASAAYLIELKSELGSWGLAAGGYNAGPNRIKAWRLGLSTLPFETRDFIQSITGHSANDWVSENFITPEFKLSETEDFLTTCYKFPVNRTPFLNAGLDEGLAPVGTWGAIVTSHFSRNKALSIYQKMQRRYASVLKEVKPAVARRVNRSFGSRPRYEVQLAADSRSEANRLCDQLKRAGGSCVVLKN